MRTDAQTRTLAAMTHPQHYADHIMRADATIEVPELSEETLRAHPDFGKGTHVFIEGDDPFLIPVSDPAPVVAPVVAPKRTRRTK